jgi:hypothetical protein
VGPVSYIYGTLKIPCGFRGSRDRQGQSSRLFLSRSFPPLLIEGSVSVRAVRGSTPRGRGPHARSGSGLSTTRWPPTRSGSGPPARAPQARSVWMPLEMTEEYKHKWRTMGRAT